MLSIIQAAGWPIWLLIACSVLALALIIERFISLQTIKVAPPPLLDEVLTVSRNAVPRPEVVTQLRQNSALGEVLASGLQALNDNPRCTEVELRAIMEGSGRVVAHRLERYLTALATIGLKTGAWWLTGSVGLLSDALESLVNLAGAMFALLMVTIAARPPDDDHPYGHHKAEYFSSGFEGILIIAAALGILWGAVDRWRHPEPLHDVGVGVVLAVISSAINGGLAWAMLRKAREVRSIALEGDARHLFTDVWTSAGVVAGLIGVMATGWHWLDPLLAMLVALNILREGVHLMRESTRGLMDEALDAPSQAQVKAVLDRFSHPERVRFDHIVSRVAGQRRFIDLHMHMPAGWTLARAAALRNEVEHALMDALPGLRASIQMLPTHVEAHLDDPPDA